jgi:hypothetical protein
MVSFSSCLPQWMVGVFPSSPSRSATAPHGPHAREAKETAKQILKHAGTTACKTKKSSSTPLKKE